MSDLVIATIRTVVPSIVGTFILLLAGWGVELDQAAQAGLVAFSIGAATGLYYLVIRIASKKFPQLEWLLGAGKKPEYKEL